MLPSENSFAGGRQDTAVCLKQFSPNQTPINMPNADFEIFLTLEIVLNATGEASNQLITVPSA
jgi:hypothetical protein